MDIDIVTEEENPMLHRKDVRFELQHDDATPSRLSVRDSLAAKLNKDSREVVVRKLDTKFGMRKTIGEARVYETPEYAQQVETDHRLERNKITADAEAESDPEEAAEDDIEEEAEEAEDEPEDAEEAEAEEESEDAEEA